MSIVIVKILIVSIFLLIGNVSSSLLSRFRNRHEYIPNADLEVIKNLDDKTYEDLMNEIPILRQVFKGNRRDNSVHVNASVAKYMDADGATELYLATPVTVEQLWTSTLPLAIKPSSSEMSTKKAPYRTHWPAFQYRIKGRSSNERRATYVLRADEYPHVFSCYWCGLNDTLLPNNSLCFDVFQSADYRLLGLSRFFRAHCHFNDTRHTSQERMNLTYPHYFEYGDDEGLKLKVIGPFMKGCFKRFVDVGTLYTSRGCRGLYHPWRSYTRSFASHRLAKLEILTTGFDDVCVRSPEASLTPFSRDISLFVRYHVCVCATPYCNSAQLHRVAELYLTMLLLLFLTPLLQLTR